MRLRTRPPGAARTLKNLLYGVLIQRGTSPHIRHSKLYQKKKTSQVAGILTTTDKTANDRSRKLYRRKATELKKLLFFNSVRKNATLRVVVHVHPLTCPPGILSLEGRGQQRHNALKTSRGEGNNKATCTAAGTSPNTGYSEREDDFSEPSPVWREKLPEAVLRGTASGKSRQNGPVVENCIAEKQRN